MRLHLNIIGKTDTGKKRKKNEDTFFVDPELGFMLVADGMGGHASGEVASQLATKLCAEQLKHALKAGQVDVTHHVKSLADLDPRTLLLGDCIKFSNQAVWEAGQTEENKNMGTTLVAALWLGGKLSIAHVGDSRLYVIRNGDITQCTHDHSFVQEQIDRGFIKPEEAEKSDLRNMLTRSVGVKEDVDVDLKEIELAPGDYILLCSDGLTKMLDDEQIAATVMEKSDPELIVNELINRANEAGGLDNVTAVLARVDAVPSLSDKVKGMFN
jgi:protein phosphatase